MWARTCACRPKRIFANVDKDKKDLYPKACLERKRTFTPMVYSPDVITREEALAAQKRLAALRSFKMKQ